MYPFITIVPRPTLPATVAPDRVLSMGQIELKFVLVHFFEIELLLILKLYSRLSELFWLELFDST